MLGIGYTAKVFNIDGKSFVHYDSEYSANYYNESIYGRKYPMGNNYALVDGTLNEVAITYSQTYDESEAVWVLVSDKTIEKDGYVAKDIEYKNADTGTAGEDLEISFSQTLFNSDDKWEYIAAIYDANPVERISLISVEGVNNGKVILKREVVGKLHHRVEFFEFILQGCAGKDDGILRPDAAYGH